MQVTKEIKALADRLDYFNEWRMGKSKDMPYPKDITADLAAAAKALRGLK